MSYHDLTECERRNGGCQQERTGTHTAVCLWDGGVHVCLVSFVVFGRLTGSDGGQIECVADGF